MPWDWNSRGVMSSAAPGINYLHGTSVPTGGGTRGESNEASTTEAWGSYEAEYLKNALSNPHNKYKTDGLDDAEKQIYLDRVTKDYQSESDESLKREFELWMLGKHQANTDPAYYQNPSGELGDSKAGAPVRRHTFRGQSAGAVPGTVRDDWRSTPWGTSSLLHLDGVRDYFRAQYERSQSEDLQMQLLADHGPQDVKSAWMYFKHWVKQRPLSEAQALDYDGPNAQLPMDIHDISPAGNMAPWDMQTSNYNKQRTRPVHASESNMYDPTHKSLLPTRALNNSLGNSRQENEMANVRAGIANLVTRREEAAETCESDSLEKEIRSEKTKELYAAQDDVLKNAEKRAATLREEGNSEDADAALRAAARIAQKMDSLRDHRLQERREAQNNDIPAALQ